MICPQCNRELTPVPRGPFHILCWPIHNLAAISKMSAAEYNAYCLREQRVANRSAAADNEIRCPNSGQPVD